ncbi:LysR family transcriptional regulator [Magnetospirillum fulvum]|uniref:DNA-binding transcriptional regulator, LysR family n=1 Tax=Magnetospirillum fulvum TaxID=1082 RepID=A0A1H6H5Y5_MAGFU|nr:LysR family transcriptional regulator [Magnetospirillum fulvum]SEH30702.1 DNA-binding transcriptional regulator, LysR family [Magnetospirillum fulvum]
MSIPHYRRYDLNLLVVLSAIFEEGNITRASQKLNLTQPAVSHALARLRDVFQDQLFVRQGAAMVPTPLARQIIAPVRTALQSLGSLTEERTFDPAADRRVFRLALRDVFESSVLPPLMEQLEKTGSLIAIHSVRTDRTEIETELRRGSIDLAMDIPFPVGDEINQLRVVRDPLTVVARRGHPQIAEGNLSLDSFLAQGHVMVSSRRKGPGIEDFELNRLGLRREIKLRCQHYFAACRVVSQTDLLLTMPGRYAQVANLAFDNLLLPLPLKIPDLDAVMYWHANMDDDPASQWLRGRLSAIFSDQPT